jgi:hypothetical protein
MIGRFLQQPVFLNSYVSVCFVTYTVLVSDKMIILVSVLGDVNSSGSAGRFRSTRQVDRVAEKAITRHPLSYDSRHDFTAVNSYGNLLLYWEIREEK